MNNDVILQIEDLRTYFNTDDGIVKAVDGDSFQLHRGETLGVVGESGCGKSVSCLSIMKLIPSPPGKIVYCRQRRPERGGEIHIRVAQPQRRNGVQRTGRQRQRAAGVSGNFRAGGAGIQRSRSFPRIHTGTPPHQ